MTKRTARRIRIARRMGLIRPAHHITAAPIRKALDTTDLTLRLVAFSALHTA